MTHKELYAELREYYKNVPGADEIIRETIAQTCLLSLPVLQVDLNDNTQLKQRVYESILKVLDK